MASIVYVTDKHMIEYHRLNGHQTICFWRPSSTIKRFKDFHQGDLLFFLAKGTEKSKRREKGIIGYGRYQQSISYSFKRLWETYQDQTGYADPESLKQAIHRLNKSNSLSPKINALILTDCVFFQSPIYLSELGMQISNKLESYLYLDKEDQEMTVKLLEKADEIGIDTWAFVSDTKPSEQVFLNDLKRHRIQLLMRKLPLVESEQKQKRITRILTQLLPRVEGEWLDASRQVLIHQNDEKINLYTVISTQKNQSLEKLIYHFGVYRLLKDKFSQLSYHLVLDQDYDINLPVEDEHFILHHLGDF